MKPNLQTIIPVEPLPKHTSDEARREKWNELSATYGLSGEFAMAARLGEDAATDEQIQMIAELFGR